ncbi:hypothetical protein MHK_006608, partial [Candidatus Magnetomorum sp. HK-1]
MSLPLSSGFHQIAAKGLIQNLTATVNINEVGTYYWSVQAVDTSFAGSSFSNEYSFTITDVAPIPGNNGIISSSTLCPYESEVTLSWNVASGTVSLTNTLEYRVYSSTISYGYHHESWEQFSTAISDWIIHTNTVTITNINETSYYYAVIVSDESGNKAIYEPLLLSVYLGMSDINLSGVDNSSAAFGDYDNDGDLDILLTGNTGSSKIAKVYRNTGGNFSEDTGINLTGVYT